MMFPHKKIPPLPAGVHVVSCPPAKTINLSQALEQENGFFSVLCSKCERKAPAASDPFGAITFANQTGFRIYRQENSAPAILCADCLLASSWEAERNGKAWQAFNFPEVK